MYINISLIGNMKSCRNIKKKLIFPNRFQVAYELLYDSSTHAFIEVGGA